MSSRTLQRTQQYINTTFQKYRLPKSPYYCRFGIIVLLSLLSVHIPMVSCSFLSSPARRLLFHHRLPPQTKFASLPKQQQLSKKTMSSSNNASNNQVIPRAAVSVVVRWSDTTTNPMEENNDSTTATAKLRELPKYAIVQRGKEPNKGLWSLPGGKIDLGETTLEAAQRELHEETLLSSNIKWYQDGAFRCTDSIHTQKETGEVQFHYVISQCFATIESEEPTLVPSDDAADAKWLSVDDVREYITLGYMTPGVLRVIEHAELLHERGLLLTE
mmetsp:Transcript_5215/g.7665  ORF Transcript_5215/g.7665 Transcript_5215/m.7665 type:complete len:273 (+) Transcript_5215:189-1007(+)